MQITPESPAALMPAPPEIFTLDVGGMKCAGCVRAVENRLQQQTGVVSATVNLVTESAWVECQAGIDPLHLATILTEAGFPAQVRTLDEISGLPADRQQHSTQSKRRQVSLAAVLLLFSAIGHLNHFGIVIPGLSNIWVHWALATLALLLPGREILLDGYRGWRNRAPNMNTLVGLGTLTAYLTSTVALLFPQLNWECFFDEPVMLVGFILLGRALEQQARGRAAAAFQSLLALQPSQARLIKPLPLAESPIGEPTPEAPPIATDIPASRVKVGEWLQVLPGEKVPVDGEVLSGQTTIDEAMLTGEAVPVVKQAGDRVAAGSLNLTGAILIRATRTGKDTTLAQIIAWVEAAQTRKAPIQKLADTVAGYFTYAVLTIALLTFLFWYFVGWPLWGTAMVQSAHGAMTHGAMTHGAMTHAAMAAGNEAITGTLAAASPLLLSLKLAIAVLVIACPCALGLATPTAILVGSSLGAERGLLIRGGDVLEKVHQLTTIVFDKTGTLTTGIPKVVDCMAIEPGLTCNQLLQLAATVESGAQHPLARAIQQQAVLHHLPLLPASDFQTIAGAGVSAKVGDRLIRLGTADWLQQQQIAVDPIALAPDSPATIVYIAQDQQMIGWISVQDQLRADAKATLEQLQAAGLAVMLLTGDQPAVASAIARSLGLAETAVLANVRPDAKGEAIAQLQQQGQRVAMVGDGINDAPALAQADVGIAMNSGTDVAIETASLVLMRDRLSDVVAAIQLSQSTFNKIRQNLFWAFFYNVLGIPIAAGCLLPQFGFILSPAAAGALMAFSSVSVVTNSLLLRLPSRTQPIGNSRS